MKSVIDTNILVSALWKKEGNAYLLLSNIISGKIIPCYDKRIMAEYKDVLMRPKFKFSASQVNSILDVFIYDGECVIPTELPDIQMPDEDIVRIICTALYLPIGIIGVIIIYIIHRRNK